eukprot:CAMPEP_0114303998 /NCGR_PEP_ID=MMETSP0059-20121206/15537_1 /TAXON_ID=36894 /ORGANISM="Pyramimonas parkeae, Strain CCMP726" /LENGTH=750 /DNA_ID=CAMNT_0001427037 /DNA_START=262 /DNA_END=2517 /DNA_ORIENTATION=+
MTETFAQAQSLPYPQFTPSPHAGASQDATSKQLLDWMARMSGIGLPTPQTPAATNSSTIPPTHINLNMNMQTAFPSLASVESSGAMMMAPPAMDHATAVALAAHAGQPTESSRMLWDILARSQKGPPQQASFAQTMSIPSQSAADPGGFGPRSVLEDALVCMPPMHSNDFQHQHQHHRLQPQHQQPHQQSYNCAPPSTPPSLLDFNAQSVNGLMFAGLDPPLLSARGVGSPPGVSAGSPSHVVIAQELQKSMAVQMGAATPSTPAQSNHVYNYTYNINPSLAAATTGLSYGYPHASAPPSAHSFPHPTSAPAAPTTMQDSLLMYNPSNLGGYAGFNGLGGLTGSSAGFPMSSETLSPTLGDKLFQFPASMIGHYSPGAPSPGSNGVDPFLQQMAQRIAADVSLTETLSTNNVMSSFQQRRCQREGCERAARANTLLCSVHGGVRLCAFGGGNCPKIAVRSTPFCIAHGGGRRCTFPSCTKSAQGATHLCQSHGGGRRCQQDGCVKSAVGSTHFCKAHGGGKRCQHPGCSKSAQGPTVLCVGHGGGRRCSHEGCLKSAVGSSGACKAHGGGRRCQQPNCTKSAQGSSFLCAGHGGGPRCQRPNCPKAAVGSTQLCKAHGGGRKCEKAECARTVHGTNSVFCLKHQTSAVEAARGGEAASSKQGSGSLLASPPTCQEEGCTLPLVAGSIFCTTHIRTCQRAECSQPARGRDPFCMSHGMHLRCQKTSCTKYAQGGTLFCMEHDESFVLQVEP